MSLCMQACQAYIWYSPWLSLHKCVGYTQFSLKRLVKAHMLHISYRITRVGLEHASLSPVCAYVFYHPSDIYLQEKHNMSIVPSLDKNA